MKRNGAQAGEGKLESRFAALTSGLLARKGQAAPSNSPIHDPAEETDAFALEPTRKADKKKQNSAPAPQATQASTKPPVADAKKPAAAPASPPAKNIEPANAAAKTAPAGPKPAQAPPAAKSPAPIPTLKVINERSADAGYPDNPSPEEIAALEAEADEVVSYFEKFGSEDAVKQEKVSFYGGAENDEAEDEDDFDPLDDLDDLDPNAVPAAAGPWAAPSVPSVGASTTNEVRAGVTVQLTAREFMRLSLGAAELDQSAQDLIAEAIEEYLDARGVLSLGGCSCLDALTKKPDGRA